MVTFDGVRYDCQGQGDFVLVKGTSGLQIQAKFTKPSENWDVTLTTGVARKADKDAPTIALTVTEENEVANVSLFVNGTYHPRSDWYEDEYYKVIKSDRTCFVLVKASNITVRAQLEFFGLPYLNAFVSLPRVP
jgi:hypothetical protein